MTVEADLAAAAAGTCEACGSEALAWGVVIDGKLVMSGGVGATAHTVFRIASMTKSFTAATVLALRDAGRLRLDDELPLLAGARATADSPAVTYRHALSMDSGLAGDDPWADRHMDMTPAAIARLVADGVVFAVPTGTAFEYSNLGYVLLGDLSAATTELLLHPLQLGRTTWVQPDHDDWVAPPGGERPIGHGAFAGMGGLWSCVADLARWVAWLDDAFPPRDDPDDGPVCRASRREMQQIHRAEGRDGGYGFGLRVLYDDRFGSIVSHSGGLPGYGSNMRWLPGRRVGVIALANATYAPMGALAQELLGILDDHDLVPPPAPVAVATALRQAAEALVALLGAWDDDAADRLFADNVALDQPYPALAAAAAELVAAHGPLRVGRLDAITATKGTLTVADGVTIELSLTPLRDGRIQQYAIKVG